MGKEIDDLKWECFFCGLEVSGERCPRCGRDSEGYTPEERMRRRPRREIHGTVLNRQPRAVSRRRLRKPFKDAVVPGSVRTSRDIFSTY